jgi:hypothetical protein
LLGAAVAWCCCCLVLLFLLGAAVAWCCCCLVLSLLLHGDIVLVAAGNLYSFLSEGSLKINKKNLESQRTLGREKQQYKHATKTMLLLVGDVAAFAW